MGVPGSDELEILLEGTVRLELDLNARIFGQRVKIVLEPGPLAGIRHNAEGRQ
jgi:hypothetical protein